MSFICFKGSVIDVGTYSDFLKKGTELSTLISAGHSDKDVHIVTEMEGEKYEGITKVSITTFDLIYT